MTVNLKDDQDAVIATTSAGPNGFYEFTGLCAGDYTVEVDETTLPPNFVPSPSNEGIDDTVDSNGSPATVTLPYDDTNDPTVDFGYNSPCTGSIGDFVWHDQNRDGIQDAGEPGIDGVTVNLRDPANHTLIATTTTDGSGYYLFTGLCVGDYKVEVVTPADFEPTESNVGDDDALDSDGSPVVVSLLIDSTQNLTIDFGYFMAQAAIDVEKFVASCCDDCTCGCCSSDCTCDCCSSDCTCDCCSSDCTCDCCSSGCTCDCCSSDRCPVDSLTWYDADFPPGLQVPVGRCDCCSSDCTCDCCNTCDVYYKFVVTNVGNVTLNNISLVDSVYDVTGCQVPASLEPGESFECIIGPFKAEEGEHTDTATATGYFNDTSYEDSDDAYYFGYQRVCTCSDTHHTYDTYMMDRKHRR